MSYEDRVNAKFYHIVENLVVSIPLGVKTSNQLTEIGVRLIGVGIDIDCSRERTCRKTVFFVSGYERCLRNMVSKRNLYVGSGFFKRLDRS